jgi:hypothetical protein
MLYGLIAIASLLVVCGIGFLSCFVAAAIWPERFEWFISDEPEGN